MMIKLCLEERVLEHSGNANILCRIIKTTTEKWLLQKTLFGVVFSNLRQNKVLFMLCL